MLLHQIITSNDHRFLKEVIEQQISNTWKGCWMEQTSEMCNRQGITTETIRTLTKEQLKRSLKKNINRRLDEHIKNEAQEKTKLRFCSNFKRNLYTMTGNLTFNNIKSIMKLRLNMLELKSNYKGNNQNETCDLCKIEKDTTEHLFECKEIKRQVGSVPKIAVLHKDEADAYSEISKFLEKICKIKNINMSKTVKENLETVNKTAPDRYTIKSCNGLKLVLVDCPGEK
jgi:hypothetical protein